MAASTISKRSSGSALTLEAGLCGGVPPGTKITRESPRTSATCSAMIMCPLCTGSKVPPKIPTLLKIPSLVVELHLADADLITGLRSGLLERRYDTFLLQLPLEVRDPLGTLPVGPQSEPLDVFTGDLVGALPNLLYAQPPEGRPEDAVLTPLVVPVSPDQLPLLQRAEPLLQEIPQPLYTLSGERRDLGRAGESLAQVLPQLAVQDVDLVEDHDHRA